ncbi:MAG TPA: hypothetical protein VFC33_20385 [Acidimicrobiia bacterium]|nr:hypothetical protein [Acidimicrobiia bacterium]
MVRRLLVCGLAVVGLVLSGASVASAATYPNGGTPPTTAQVEARTAVAPATVPSSAPSSGLPFTGGDVAGLASIGAGAIVLGAFLTRRGRRRAH